MSDIYLSITETPTVVTLSQPVVSSALAGSVTVTNVVSVNVVTMPAITVQAAAPAVTTVGGSVAVSNFPSVTTVAGTVALDSASLIALENVTVTVGAAVTVAGFSTSSLPPSTVTVANTVTIAGTVTANAGIPIEATLFPLVKLLDFSDGSPAYLQRVESNIIPGIQQVIYQNAYKRIIYNNNVFRWDIQSYNDDTNQWDLVAKTSNSIFNLGIPPTDVPWYDSDGSPIPCPISLEQPQINKIVGSVTVGGTVTVGNSVTIGSLPAISGTVTARLQDASGNNLTSTSIGGVQRLNVSLASAATPGGSLPSFVNVYGGTDSGTVRAVAVDSSGRSVVTVSNFPATQSVSLASTTVTVSSLPNVTIGNTVTVSQASAVTIGTMPGGALTTRFGTPATASTAFLTTAVTNTSRKYLLIQNVTTGANVITVGVGFVPTTTQGIQLTAGAGITFESSYIPTGAVWVLSSVTASNYTILEA